MIKKIIITCLTLFMLSGCSITDEKPQIGDESEESEEIMDDINKSTFEHLYDLNDKYILENVYVIHMSDLKSNDEILLAVSLQGILAQNKASVYIINSGDASIYWLDSLNITYHTIDNVWDLLDMYIDEIPMSYVLYELNTESVNVATTLSGVERLLMVTVKIEDEAINHGLTLTRDVRDRDTRWVIENFKNSINFNAVATQPINNLANRDFIISQKGLILTHIQNDLEGYEDLIPDDTPMLGWGVDEVSDVEYLSTQGITTIASDHAWNISFLSQVKPTTFKQLKDDSIPQDLNKHFVSFIMTDGDNIQWLLGNDHFFDEKRYGNENRGDVPMGWTIAPLMYTLAPSALNAYYEHATLNDEMIGGPSGIGYINPDVYPSDALLINAKRTNDYYEALDLDYMTIIGSQNNFYNHTEVLDVYAQQS
ncbi:hypothetical protein KHQ89_05920 [Mycoplasmatota bacterium]|nr:hypothetical protein KHQ89_05920 [Mycoplasmatota bacterium]